VGPVAAPRDPVEPAAAPRVAPDRDAPPPRARCAGGARVRALAGAAGRGSGRAVHGFTLIELLVALLLLAIVASLAWPAYREQVARARRADVQAALLEDAGYMQRYYAANNAYAATPAPDLPVAASPRAGAAGYRISVGAGADAAAGYLLTATRTGAMADDRCGDFTYDDLGRKGLVAGSFDAGLSVAACWR